MADGRGGQASTTFSITVLAPPLITATPASCELPAAAAPPGQGVYRDWSFRQGSTIAELALSEDGRRLVAGDQGGALRLFSRDNNVPLWTYTVASEQFNSVAISRSGRSVAAACTDAKVYLFECDSPSPAWIFDTHGSRGSVVDVAISHDGTVIAAADYTHVYLLSRASNVPVKVFDVPIERGGWLTTVAVSGDGQRIAAGTWISDSSGARMFLFDQNGLIRTYNSDYQSQLENAVAMPIAMSKDGSRIAFSGADRRLYFLSSAAPGGVVAATPAWSVEVAQAGDDQVSCLSISDDGTSLMALGDNRCLYFADTSVGTPTWTFNGSHVSGLFPAASVYPTSKNTAADLGIGHYAHAGMLSADGKYLTVGASNAGRLFSLYRGVNRPFRVYDLDVTPVTISVPALGGVDQLLGLGSCKFTRTLVKPGRGGSFREDRSLWALLLGGVIPVRVKEDTFTFTLPDGNFDQVSSESMDIPELFQSYVTTITAFIIQVELFDQPSGRKLSSDDSLFANIQVGMGGG